MKKSSFAVLFSIFVFSFIAAFASASRADGYTASVFAPLKIITLEARTFMSSSLGHVAGHCRENHDGRVAETEHSRNLTLIFSKADSVRLLENIKIRNARAAEVLCEKNCRGNLFAGSPEQSATSKNKSRHSETRRNIQQRK